jgi:hypothetical protein
VNDGQVRPPALDLDTGIRPINSFCALTLEGDLQLRALKELFQDLPGRVV